MKLLKPAGCSFSSGGGNVKERTMIVEEQGIGFWTGVRFPSGPLKNSARRNALALFFYDFRTEVVFPVPLLPMKAQCCPSSKVKDTFLYKSFVGKL